VIPVSFREPQLISRRKWLDSLIAAADLLPAILAFYHVIRVLATNCSGIASISWHYRGNLLTVVATY
ncbi:MAG TPA: hypothetical protein VMB73_27980, partial [Acetobacteraceae bacterium]|nr:hypothetical protein [Acetobacteraceae bacterium]